MPHFYIDLHDGTNFVRDDQGFDLPSEDAALVRLTNVMTRLAKDVDAVLGRQDLMAIVRDHTRRVVFRAHLSLDIERV